MEVELTPDAVDDYNKLPLTVRARVDGVFERLRRWPQVSGVKWLSGPWKGFARIRTGDWRVIFHLLNNRVIEVVRIADRRDVYDD